MVLVLRAALGGQVRVALPTIQPGKAGTLLLAEEDKVQSLLSYFVALLKKDSLRFFLR